MDREDLLYQLRKLFPNGHEDFMPIMVEQIALHNAKNHDYTKGGKALSNFDRLSKILALYPGLKLTDQKVIAMLHALKQIDAVLWGLSEGIDHKVEGLDPRLADISVLATIIRCMIRDEKK